MKVLFLQPPIQDFYNTRFREYPLGLLYLAASLDAAVHDVSLLDAKSCKKPKSIPLPFELKYLESYYTKENNLFLNYKHFGLNFDEIGERVLGVAPDVVCINAMFTPYFGEVVETAKTIKKVLPQCLIFVGGYHATVDPDFLIQSGYVDVVVRGEGEEILTTILNDFVKPSHPLLLDNAGTPFVIGDLNKLNFPARNLLNSNHYLFNKKPYTMILTSRGCPNRCVFCSIHSMARHEYRVRDTENVLEEIDECIKKYGIQVFDFQDDNLLFDMNRIKNVFEKLIVKYGKQRFEWLATNGLNVGSIDREMLLLMKDLGFRKLDISLATGSVPGRNNLSRPETIEQYENVLNIANSLNFETTTYIILGLPEQPLEEMQHTIEYLSNKKTLISPSVFYNVPGMPIFEKMKAHEYQSAHIVRRSTAFNNRGLNFTRDDIFKLFKAVRTNNLLKSHNGGAS